MSSSIPIPQLTGHPKNQTSSNSHNVNEDGRAKLGPSAPVQRSPTKKKAPPPPRPPPPVLASTKNESASSKRSAITRNGQIRRCALGRVASFGQLYDARNDTFLQTSIFKNGFLPTSHPIHSSEIHKLEDNSFANTLSKLDMEPEQQLSILTSLSPFDPEANWQRLNTAKKFDRNVMTALIYKLHTTDDIVDIFQEDFASVIDADSCQEEATHVVVGIQFGGLAVLSLQYKNQDNREVDEIEGILSEQMDKLSTAINGNSPASFRDFDRAHGRDVEIRCFGDTFQSDKDGRTLDRAFQILKELPSEIASTNEGKGAPIMYLLHPIVSLPDHFKLVLQKSIPFTPVMPAILQNVIRELDQIVMAKAKLNAVNQLVSDHQFCVGAEIIPDVSNLQRHMSKAKDTLIQVIASSLPQVRSGHEDEGEIYAVLQQFQSSNASPGHILKQLRKYDQILAKIYLADALIREGAHYIGNGSSLEEELQKYPESRIILLFFSQNSETLDPNKWEGDRELFFTEMRKKEDGCEYFAVDCDIHPSSLPTSMSSLVQVIHPGSSEFEDLFPEQYLESPEEEASMTNSSFETENVPTTEDPVHSKELNILILGETGVGKSTWINSFKNYITFDSLEAAEQGALRTLIPSKFTVYSEDFEQITVSTGSDPNEGEQPGESATQQARVYPFTIEDTLVRLIDTPGIGDTRGIDQDKLNFQNILTTLSYLEEIHGICIFLKPNNSRLNLMFRFCVKELLKYLHRDASKNILFCFTNSRGTLYRPGDTYPALMTLLGENKEVDIPVNRETVYCFDSEAYRYLASVKNSTPVRFSEEERQNFSNSWDNSVIEMHRMVDHIKGLPPHPIQSTLNLNYVRELILKMVRPLAEITRNVQTNRTIMEQEKLDIQGTKETIKDLEKKRLTKRTEIKVSPLSHPRMVCANQKCVRVWSVGDVKTTQYDRICHDKCKLFLVKQDSIGSPLLRLCSKLRTGNCKHKDCGHGYKEHLRIYYESRQEVLEGVNQAVVDSINSNLGAREMKQNMIEEKNDLIKEYQNELGEIEIATTTFAYFLKINAITQFSDEMEVYLDQLMKEERYKVDAGGNRKTLELLEQSLKTYRDRKVTLEREVQAGRKAVPTSEEVNRLVKNLQKLKHSGKSLMEALECVNKNNKLESKSFRKAFPEGGGGVGGRARAKQ